MTADLGRVSIRGLTPATQPAGPWTHCGAGAGWWSTPAAPSGTSVRSRAPARRSTDQHRAARRAATSTPRAAGSIPTPPRRSGSNQGPASTTQWASIRRLRRLLTRRRWALWRLLTRRGGRSGGTHPAGCGGGASAPFGSPGRNLTAMKTKPMATFQPASGPISGLLGAMQQTTIHKQADHGTSRPWRAIQRAPPSFTGTRLGAESDALLGGA